MLALGLLVACSSPEPPPAARPLSAEEAEVLALVRWANYDAGTREFSTRVQDFGISLSLRGWVDYEAERGYALVTGEFAAQTLAWTVSEVGIAGDVVPADDLPPLPMPALDDARWSVSPLDPSSSRLDSLLAVLTELGSDRPDNPLLLQQSGALRLRDDAIDGVSVTVFATPPRDEALTGDLPDADTSPLRLWVTAEGRLLRAELRLGADWTTVDFAAESGPSLG